MSLGRWEICWIHLCTLCLNYLCLVQHRTRQMKLNGLDRIDLNSVLQRKKQWVCFPKSFKGSLKLASGHTTKERTQGPWIPAWIPTSTTSCLWISEALHCWLGRPRSFEAGIRDNPCAIFGLVPRWHGLWRSWGHKNVPFSLLVLCAYQSLVHMPRTFRRLKLQQWRGVEPTSGSTLFKNSLAKK